MSIDNDASRRTVLIVGAGGVAAAALAACSSSGSSTNSPPKSQQAGAGTTGSTTAADSSSADSSAADSSSAATTSAGSSGAGSTSAGSSGSGTAAALTTLSAVPVGGAVAVKLAGGKPGIVARPSADKAVCFSAVCTHQGCTVKPAGGKLDCPCHGSVFDALTGKVLQGPAPSPLPSVPVKISGGKVVAA